MYGYRNCVGGHLSTWTKEQEQCKIYVGYNPNKLHLQIYIMREYRTSTTKVTGTYGGKIKEKKMVKEKEQQISDIVLRKRDFETEDTK